MDARSQGVERLPEDHRDVTHLPFDDEEYYGEPRGDVVRFARQADIPVSTRGSVANSLVAYCLGITQVDPIANELLFERFLNPARANLPDIDLDFCSRQRDKVLAYVRHKYGADQVSLVATVSTMQLRSAVRALDSLMGRVDVENILDELFASFCLVN